MLLPLERCEECQRHREDLDENGICPDCQPAYYDRLSQARSTAEERYEDRRTEEFLETARLGQFNPYDGSGRLL